MNTLPTCKTLLIIGYVWPEPKSSAAGSRMIQLIELFQKNQWYITFASPAKLGEHKTDLTSLGITEQQIELNNSNFDDFLHTLQPGLVIFDRFMMEEQFGWRVAKVTPNAIRILNTEDLHSLRACRQQLIKDYLKTQPDVVDLASLSLTDQAWLFQNMAANDLTKREIAAIFRSDITLMISEFEMALLQDAFQVPASQLVYLPFLYAKLSKLAKQNLPTWSQRNHFISIGNFRHEPNWDAVLWLKESIWPLIRKQLPQAELHIYGAYPPPKATALHNEKQGFLVKGWADDAFEVIQNSRVLLAPLRFGAGIKGKLAEAQLNRTPSVTTLIGAESMFSQNHSDWPGAIANNTQDFANAAIELYQNKTLWQEKSISPLPQNDSADTIKPYQDKQNTIDYGQGLLDKIDGLSSELSQLNKHRNQHFIGAMLNHHHHKSTQYMAQWIEAKNRIDIPPKSTQK